MRTKKNGKVLRKVEAEECYARIIKHIDGTFQEAILCGSYRRENLFLNDLDIVVLRLEGFHSKVGEMGIFGNGDKKISGELTNFLGKEFEGVHVDFYMASLADMGAQKLTWTGSMKFNIRCRAIAKLRGWKLNQYGLFDINGVLISNTEEGILGMLNLEEYNEPYKRVS